MHPVVAIAAKDLRSLTRDRVALFFVAFFPLLYGVFFGMVFGGNAGETARIPVAIVDLDGSEASRAFVEALGKDSNVRLHPEATQEDALRRVREGDYTGAVVLPEGFGSADLFAGSPQEIRLGVDPSRKAEAGMLQGLVLRAGFERLRETFTDPAALAAQADRALGTVAGLPAGAMPEDMRAALLTLLDSLKRFSGTMPTPGSGGAEGDGGGGGAGFEPIRVTTLEVQPRRRAGPDNAFAITFPQAAVWGVLGATAGFGVSMVQERHKGTLARLRAAPIARRDILLGKALACFATVVGVVTLLLVVARVAFDLRPASPGLLAAAVVSTGVCFVGLMMLLASIARTEQAAGGIGWAVMLVFAMIGGGMVPLLFMPAWMLTVSNVSPVKWAILALEGAVWRGFTPGQMLLPCGVLVGVGVAAFAAGAWTLARER